ncbi:MAG: hypothetical protein H0U88_05645 [Chthoniobacterales bacterium]|nr:hypothetical protein [Chthoniobacterales bacterium]
MKLNSVTAILRALNAAEVRVLVVGGLAVNAHGYLRLTKDADLAIDLVAENILRAFQALSTLGYSPRVPITATQFADPALRATWIREKEMKVLQFFSDQHRETPVDVFVIEPFDFAQEYARAVTALVDPTGTDPTLARYVAIAALIRMKEDVGRPRDLDDVEHLRWILEEQRDE